MSELLPRLANLIALRSADAVKRERLRRHLHTLGWQVREPAPLWLVAIRALPHSQPADARDEAAGLFCCADQTSLPQDTTARAARRAQLHKSRQAARGESVDDLHGLSVQPDNSAVFMRSLGGTIPAYWWPDGDDLWLSTTSGDLIAIAGHDGTPDRLMTALCLQVQYNQQIAQRSHLAGVSKLSFAETLVITPDGQVSSHANWLPPARDEIRWPSRQSRRDRAERFRQLLDDQLDRHLTHEGLNLLTLSGGVDSSLLLALCSEKAFPLASFSRVPPTRDAHHARETARLDWLLAHYPCRISKRIELDKISAPDAMQALLPAGFPMFNPTLSSLSLLSDSSGARVSLGGEDADIVCGSYHFTPLDWLLHAPRHAVLLPPAAFPRGLRRLDLLQSKQHPVDFALRWNAPLTRILEPWLHRDIHAEWQETQPMLVRQIREDLTSMGNPMLWHFHVQSEWQAMQWEWCSAQSVRRLNPFTGSAMIALAMHSHPGERLAFRDKQLSRNAYAGRFPAPVLGRHDKGGVAIPAQPVPMTLHQIGDLLGPMAKCWRGMIDPSILVPQATASTRRLVTVPTHAGSLRRLAGLSQQPARLQQK